jgi:type I restriction enzyme, S subunit
MSLAKYKEYKDTESFWLDKIPTHWNKLPGIAVFSEKQVKNFGLSEKRVLSLSYGKIIIKPPEKLHGLVPESFETYQIVEPGDIIIRSTDLQNDKVSLRVGKVNDKGIITSAYLCLKSKDGISEKYAHLMLHVLDLTKVLYGLGSGLRQNLSWTDFKRFPFFIPPIEEQKQIVRYLDWKTDRITNFIKEKKRMIELMKEQKQVLINDAVTGKVDVSTEKPYPLYKDSGLEWLGMIPDGWKVRRLKTIATVQASGVDKKSYTNEIPVRLCNYIDVYKNDRITDKIDFMSATATLEEIKSLKIRIGDVIITKDSESWKDIAVPSYVSDEIDAICAYHLSLIRTYKGELDGEFLFYAFLSNILSYQFQVSAVGVTRYGLSKGAIRGGIFPIPPLSVQIDICKYLASSIKNIEILMQKAYQEIQLIQEYRPRLISDVVTGKIDVRDVMVPKFEAVDVFTEFDGSTDIEEVADETNDEINEVES